MQSSEPLLRVLLSRRQKKGKEDAARIGERMGQISKPRPSSPVIWLHSASVGEAQSALILIDHILGHADDACVLVTTGTVTSARRMEQTLPERCFHQYMPLDHPDYISAFLDHWRPDLIFWMESELWPVSMMAIKKRGIPAILVNGRLSARSYRRWRFLKRSAKYILGAFDLILCQTPEDEKAFRSLGATKTHTTDNIKYSARPLPADDKDVKTLSASTYGRPVWLYASTHAGEEAIACRIHEVLKNTYPDLLTIIVPRHPERGDDIASICAENRLDYARRSLDKELPKPETDIYLADTMGELGLFYRIAPIAVIGRSLSHDGGGGHNPIEAAQLSCVILHGPNIQYQADIFRQLDAAGACLRIENEDHLLRTLRDLMEKPELIAKMQKKALDFAHSKSGVIKNAMNYIHPYLESLQKSNAS